MLEMTKTFELFAVREGIFHRQNAAPRVAEEDEIVGSQMERAAHLLDLVDEAAQIPQLESAGFSLRPDPNWS